jgi:four helix bundle protein
MRPVMIKSFLDLEVYKESYRLSLEIDELVEDFPKSERFLLVDQMKRASRAIPALIAEGYAKRESLKEFRKYLKDALAEANEMVNHFAFAKDKDYIKKTGYADELIERYHVVGKKLTNLRHKWQNY